MKLSYNGFSFEGLGMVQVVSDTGQAWPAEAPQNFRRRLKIRVLTNEPGYLDNHALVTQGRSALTQTQGRLVWMDDNENLLLDRPVTVVGHDWPEQPNAWGTYHQVLEIELEYFEPLDAANSGVQTATLRENRENAPTAVLEGVEGVKYLLGVTRFDDLRAHRRQSDGRIELRGRIRADATKEYAERRLALVERCNGLIAVVKSGMESVLNFGTTAVNKVVRVDNFSASVDQSMWWIEWALTVRFTEFPNEAGYAQCVFSVNRREDKATGTVVVGMSGEVMAESESAARAKWRTVRNGAMGLNGIGSTTWMVLRSDSRSEQISGEDGAAFLKMSFEEEWQKQSGGIIDWVLRIEQTDEVESGLGRKTYAGTVTARAATYDAAYAICRTKARELGYGKYQMLKRSSEEGADHLRLGGDDGLGNETTVIFSFSYEYQVKGARMYLEISSVTQFETWGNDSDQVSGFVVAADRDVMNQVYLEVKAGFSGVIMRGEQVAQVRHEIGDWDYAGEKEKSPPSRTRQFLRWDFSFTVVRPKTTPTVRYEWSVEKNIAANERITTISGTVWASAGDLRKAAAGQAEDEATAYLDAFLASVSTGMELGVKKQDSRRLSLERAPTIMPNGTSTGPEAEHMAGLDFTISWTGVLSGTSAILQSEVTERIQQAGENIVMQATANSIPVLQVCGKVGGVRQVRGSVTATTESACIDWLKRQRALPPPIGLSGKIAGAVVSAGRVGPVSLEFTHKYLELEDGAVRGGRPMATKVQLVHGTFEFTEFYEELGGLVG